MRIEPTGIPQLPPGAPAPRTGAKAADASAPVAADSGTFAPSADLAALLSAVKQAPEVRTAVIERAAAQLAEGAFATPEAAADAAKALLDSGDAQ